MTIYTSYYANIPNIPENFFLVATSGWIPPEIEQTVDSWNQSLAPSKDIYNEYETTPDWKKYTQRFISERLTKVDWLEKLDQWEEKANKIGKNIDTIVLLCYEKPEDFCHRQILAESIENEFKTTVQEFGHDKYDRIDYRMKAQMNTDFLF